MTGNKALRGVPETPQPITKFTREEIKLEKIMIQKQGEMMVASIHITEEELVDAFQQASQKVMDELAAKGQNPLQNMMEGLRDALVCEELTEILFSVDEAEESRGGSENAED